MDKTIVIFSHGLGLRKDAGGLFTDISAELQTVGIQSILFDYNEYDESTRELFALSFSEQAKKLQVVIDTTYQNNPDARLVIIGHSQGSVIPALCDLTHISAVLILSPFFHTDMKDVLDRYSKLAGNTLNLTGNSRRKRSDGSTTVIPAEYWKERFATDVVGLYNKIAEEKALYIIYALQDTVMEFTEHNRIKNAYMLNIDGDHDFKIPYRPILMKEIIRIMKFIL